MTSFISRWVVVGLAGMSCLLFPGSAWAQTPDTAALRGIVTGPNAVALSGAMIVVEDAQQRVLRTMQTDAQGTFATEGLPAEQPLQVLVRFTGLADATSARLELAAGATATLQLQMQIPSVHAEVLVTGAAGEVRTDEPQLGDRLAAEQVRALPLLNRRITWLPLLNAANRPAINQGDIFMNQDLFTANGTGRRQTWFEVDGANGNDVWGRQTIFTNVPLDTVAEMTVLDSAFTADYGFGEGAVVNIVTRRGGSEYHGDILGLWRPSGPEAELSGFSSASATSGNDITRDTLAQGAATASGPLAHQGRIVFLASGEYSYQDRASPVTSPIAPGNYIGHYRDWLGLLRIDQTFSQVQHAFLHLGADSFFDTNPNGIVGGNALPTVARVFHRRTYTAELGDTAVLGPSMVNEARLQFQLASPITQFSPVVYGTEFSVPISSGGTFTSGTSQSALLINRQFEAVDTLALARSRSELRVGFDVIHARNGGNSKEFGGPIYDGELIYKTCTGTIADCESATYLENIANVQSYTQSYGNADYVVDDTLAAVFAQEDAHPTSDLTLNVGLRYELQTFTDSRADLAPRIGFAYDVAGHATTTLRGGFGIYDAQVVDNAEANYALTGPTGVFNYTAAPGEPGFPASVADVPLPAFPTGAVAPLRSLYLRPGRAAYYNQLLSHQHAARLSRRAPQSLQRAVDAGSSSGSWRPRGSSARITSAPTPSASFARSTSIRRRPYIRTMPGLPPRTAQAANCTRPYWIAWYAQNGLTCDSTPKQASGPTPPYAVIQSDVNDGAGLL